MSENRYARQIRLFGDEGQRRIGQAHVVTLGVGGLGMPLTQQLAYLGVQHQTVADADIVDLTSLNRLTGATVEDIDMLKVLIAERTIRAIQPSARVNALPVNLPDARITAAISEATIVVGCFDRETPRLTATDLCSAAGIPYVDLATEVIADPSGPVFGGRVVFAGDGAGCLSCLDVIDARELARERMTQQQRKLHDAVYGIERAALGGSGPSVVTVNSVIASLGATEIMCLLTGLRTPARQLNYRGDLGTVGRPRDTGREDCPFCLRWRTTSRPAATG